MLGEKYTQRLRAAYASKVPGKADLVVYWVQKTVELALAGSIQSFGLVATKSIAKGASRKPLDLLAGEGRQFIYNAWTNEPWVVEGAAVRVCIVCGSSPSSAPQYDDDRYLNGVAVEHINPDLTDGIDVTQARKLSENAGIAFQGVKLTGPFGISGQKARKMLDEPLNPNGRPNSDVIARLYDIDDIVGRDSDGWVVDFGTELKESEAALYESPYKIILNEVVPFRADPEKCRSTEERLVTRFWEFQRPRPDLRKALLGKTRFIVTPESSEHRVFVWIENSVLIQGSLFAICSDSDVVFGILSSSIHEAWSTAQGNRLGVGNQRRYNIGVTFETFPFPRGMSPGDAIAEGGDGAWAHDIGHAARELDRLRGNWLNPLDQVERVAEEVGGYPERVLPLNDKAAALLKRRTLTLLYNENPAWLRKAHQDLDKAVFAAYGWPVDLTNDELLRRLIDLNLQRAVANQMPPQTPRRQRKAVQR